MEPLVAIVDLHKTYTGKARPVHALQGVTLDIFPGEFVSIVGRSGCGKSTLLNLIGGLDRATSGVIRFDGRDLSTLSRAELAEHRRFRVGMVFQSFNLIGSMTAVQNVELALTFGRVERGTRRQRAIRLLEEIGLRERMDHYPAELSGGEAQRVALARALANEPPLLLADEPTGNLDSATAAEILACLGDLHRRGVTIVMVTHDRGSAEAFSDRVIRLLDGRVAENLVPGEHA